MRDRPLMAGVSLRFFNQGPRAISPDLFYWRAGSWARCQIEGAGTSKVAVTTPDAFLALMNEFDEMESWLRSEHSVGCGHTASR